MSSFTHSLPMILYRALDGVMPVYRDLFARHDLTEQQWRVLRVVWRNSNVTSATLAESTLLTAPSLVGIIDRLERKELVTRVRSVDDRRQVYVIATAKGRKLQAEVLPELEAIQNELRARISEKEWDVMERILGKISASVETAPISDRADIRQAGGR